MVVISIHSELVDCEEHIAFDVSEEDVCCFESKVGGNYLFAVLDKVDIAPLGRQFSSNFKSMEHFLLQLFLALEGHQSFKFDLKNGSKDLHHLFVNLRKSNVKLVSFGSLVRVMSLLNRLVLCFKLDSGDEKSVVVIKRV